MVGGKVFKKKKKKNGFCCHLEINVSLLVTSCLSDDFINILGRINVNSYKRSALFCLFFFFFPFSFFKWDPKGFNLFDARLIVTCEHLSENS